MFVPQTTNLVVVDECHVGQRWDVKHGQLNPFRGNKTECLFEQP